MRAAAVVCVLLVSALLVNWIRSGQDFPIVQSVPFLGGHEPSLYDVGGLCLLALMGWGAMRLRRLRRDDQALGRHQSTSKRYVARDPDVSGTPSGPPTSVPLGGDAPRRKDRTWTKPS